MLQATTCGTLRTRRLLAVGLAACFGMLACSSEGDASPEPTQARPPQPAGSPARSAPAADGGAIPPRVASPPARPSPAAGGATAALPGTLMSTSGSEATAGQVWGEVIGSNVGAAQSCGAGDDQVATYLRQVRWHVASLGTMSAPPDDYLQAYEQAREKSASVVRGQADCEEILSAIER